MPQTVSILSLVGLVARQVRGTQDDRSLVCSHQPMAVTVEEQLAMKAARRRATELPLAVVERHPQTIILSQTVSMELVAPRIVVMMLGNLVVIMSIERHDGSMAL